MTQVAELVTTIRGKDVGLAQLLTTLEKRLQKLDQAANASASATEAALVRAQNRAADALAKTGQAADRAGKQTTKSGQDAGKSQEQLAREAARAEAAMLRHAIAQARFAQATGNATAGITTLKAAIASSTQTSTAAVNAMRALAEMENRLSNAKGPVVLPRTIDGLSGSAAKAAQALSGIAGVTGIALSTQQLISLGEEAIQASLKLQKSQNTLRLLAGDSQLYAEALATAKEQQRLFGGSLADTIDGLSGLITVSRSSGASLQSLVDLTARLSIKDPSQGIAGARIALNEALSGDPTSLAKRYEIPKAALAALRDESTTTSEKLAVIDAYLNDIGITSAVVADAVPKTTIAINALGASLEGLQVSLGAALGEGLTPAITGLTALTDALQGIGTQDTLVALASTLSLLSGNVGGLSEAERQLAADLLASLGIRTQVQQADQARGDAMLALAGAFEQGSIGIAQLNQLTTAAAGISAEHTAALQAALAEYQKTGDITAFGLALQALAGAQQIVSAGIPPYIAMRQQAADADRNAAAATHEANTALLTAIQADQQAALGAQQVSQAKADLERVTQMVIDGLLTNEQAAANLAARYPALAGQTDLLIQKQLQLAGAAREAANALAATGAGKILSGGLKWLDQQKQTLGAMRDYNEAVGGSAAKIRNLQRDLQGVKQGSAEWYRIQTQIANLQSKGGGGGGGGGSARLSDAEKFAQKQETIETSLYQKLEDAAADHADRLLDIERDFYKRSEEQRKKNEVSKRQSRYSFYSTITDAGSGIEDDGARANVQAEAQRIAAEYEAAFAESQRMAQAGQQQLAAEYLALKQRQLEEDLRFAEERARAQAEGDKAEVARLDALNKLREEAQAEEEKQLLEGGDANQKARDEATANEQQRYDEATQSAETAADRKIAAAQRSTDAILTENQALQEQARLYQQIGGRPGAQTTPTGAPTTGGAAPQTASAPTSAPATVSGAGDPGAAWGDLEAAIGRLQDATSGGLRDVVRAVQGLQSQFVR